MAKAPRPWTVLSPGPLQSIDDNLWAVEDDVPGVPGFRRRMTIVRRSDGTLLFYNALPVGEETLAAIRALGKPAYLVVPNRFHDIDAPPFRDKLALRAFSPATTLAAVRERLECASIDDLPADPAMKVRTVDGFKTGEVVLVVHSGPRASVVVADLVIDIPHGRGFSGFMFRMLGFTGDRPKLPRPVRWRVLRDKDAVRSLLLDLASTAGLARLVLSHGANVDQDPAGVLRDVAGSL